MKQKSVNWMTAPPPAEGIPPGVNLARLVVFTLACCGILLGCAELRKATYPSDFVYLERKQVVSQMALMSLLLCMFRTKRISLSTRTPCDALRS